MDSIHGLHEDLQECSVVRMPDNGRGCPQIDYHQSDMKPTIFLLPLLLVGCGSTASGQIDISTPSGQTITTACPGETEAERKFCDEASRLIGADLTTTLKACKPDEVTYSLKGDLRTDDEGQSQPVAYRWDCNSKSYPREDLLLALLKARVREEGSRSVSP